MCLGNMIGSILSQTLCHGFNSALETLVSQAFGAGNMKLAEDILRRNRLILIVLFIPITAALSYTEDLLLALGQDSVIANKSGNYCFRMIPGMLFQALFNCQRLFMNAIH
jgi:multidrug resistance protein, MATE family